LVLLWKDALCSRFLIDTKQDGTKQQLQYITLAVHNDNTVRALEGETLGVLPREFVTEAGIRPGNLLRFSITGVDSKSTVQSPRVSGLTYAGIASEARVLPDSWTKIVFQNNARNDAVITAAQILESLSSPRGAMPDKEMKGASTLISDSSSRLLPLSVFSSALSSSPGVRASSSPVESGPGRDVSRFDSARVQMVSASKPLQPLNPFLTLSQNLRQSLDALEAEPSQDLTGAPKSPSQLTRSSRRKKNQSKGKAHQAEKPVDVWQMRTEDDEKAEEGLPGPPDLQLEAGLSVLPMRSAVVRDSPVNVQSGADGL